MKSQTNFEVVVKLPTLQLTFTEEEVQLLNLLGHTSQYQREAFLTQNIGGVSGVTKQKTEALASLLASIYFATEGFNK